MAIEDPLDPNQDWAIAIIDPPEPETNSFARRCEVRPLVRH